MTRPLVIVFVKAPALGRVKSRLAREIGALSAMVLYRRVAGALIRRIRADRRWRVVLAVTPDGAARLPVWPKGLALMPQGEGHLGARMLRMIGQAGDRPVVVVGSDIPGLGPAHLAAAFRALRSHDAVFGPAVDGGYWLMGFRHRRLAPVDLDHVRWSGPHALADTLAALRPGTGVAFLERLRDLDDAADLRALGLAAPGLNAP